MKKCRQTSTTRLMYRGSRCVSRQTNTTRWLLFTTSYVSRWTLPRLIMIAKKWFLSAAKLRSTNRLSHRGQILMKRKFRDYRNSQNSQSTWHKCSYYSKVQPGVPLLCQASSRSPLILCLCKTHHSWQPWSHQHLSTMPKYVSHGMLKTETRSLWMSRRTTIIFLQQTKAQTLQRTNVRSLSDRHHQQWYSSTIF